MITSVQIYKNTKVITNKSKCTYDTQKNKNTQIKAFSRTDQVRDFLLVLFGLNHDAVKLQFNFLYTCKRSVTFRSKPVITLYFKFSV